MNLVLKILICVIIGYLIGTINPSYIIGKIQGFDIRKKGSGNAGASNALIMFGKIAGILCAIFDIAKASFAVFLTSKIIFPDFKLAFIISSVSVILGHMFPFYMGFKGGKGIAATAGLILSFHPYFIITGVILFFGAFFITHYVSLGSLLVYAGFMIQMVICGQTGFFEGMSQAHLIEMYAITAFLAIMAYVKHWANIKRLLSGTERKTYLSKKNKVQDGENNG